MVSDIEAISHPQRARVKGSGVRWSILLPLTCSCCVVAVMHLISKSRSSCGAYTVVRSTNEGNFVPINNTQCEEDPSLTKLLQHVATSAKDSYLLEEVLMQKLSAGICRPNPSKSVTLDRIMFLVLCSVNKKERLEALQETWVAWLPPQNVMLLAEEDIPGHHITLMPPLPADDYIKQRHPNVNSYEAAGLRHLRSVQWLGKVNTTALDNIDWVFMVDDDTFVNLPLLLLYLQNLPSNLPLLIGYFFDRVAVIGGMTGLAWPAGGAGMLFTKMAFRQMATVLFTPMCKVQTFYGDVNIGICAVRANVTKVHSRKFFNERIQDTYSPSISDVGMAISMHRVVEKQQFVSSTCLVSKRFGWPHKLCSNHSVICDPLCNVQQVQ